jgi:ribosomal protein L40E
MVAFAPLLRNWVENHPLKDDNDAPLWANKTVYFGRGCKPETLTYERLSAIIRFVAAKAGVKKKVNPHSFRHARATHLAKVLPEQQLKAIFGWTQASSMAAIYVHLSGRDTDDAILAMHGMKQTQKTSMLSPQVCNRCKETNSANNNLCQKCGYPLNDKGTGELASFEQKLAKLEKLSDLLREPEVWKALVAAMEKKEV